VWTGAREQGPSTLVSKMTTRPMNTDTGSAYRHLQIHITVYTMPAGQRRITLPSSAYLCINQSINQSKSIFQVLTENYNVINVIALESRKATARKATRKALRLFKKTAQLLFATVQNG